MPVPIVRYPDARLRKPAAALKGPLTKQIKQRFLLMLEAMHANKGAGLAACQIGWDARVFVTCHTDDPKDDCVFINPSPPILFGADVWGQEGCLSLPGQVCNVLRSEKVTIKATDVDGQERTVNASGWWARIIQHEFDHLEARLLIDKKSDLAR